MQDDNEPYSRSVQTKAGKIVFWEGFGTMIFAFGILTSAGSDFQVALSLYAGIFFVAPFTGGHLNPAVSLAKFLNGEITKKEFWIYAGSQCLGAFLGNILAMLIPNLSAQPYQLFAGKYVIYDILNEVLGTFIFVTFILVMTNPKTQLFDTMILIVLSISISLYFSRQFALHSGGALNPAMAITFEFARTLISLDFTYLVRISIYLLGEFVGASLAALFYIKAYAPRAILLGAQCPSSEPEVKEYQMHKIS